ncbi:MAG: hydroxymethylbilane synthase [Anaerolineae bacterium]|nr:hydroxymethylbilane synthase [Anaerolineae bacterium]
MNKLVFATRPSKLARWQTNHVISLLESHWPDLSCEEIVITTKGDQILDRPLPEIGGKGLFTLELEEALRSGQVDAAVHSLKDLPTENSPGLVVGAIPPRAPVGDALVCPGGHSLADLPPGALVGTSSLRRQAQLLAFRPDLKTASIRGNVETRIRKAQEGQYDAILLAAAGLTRLGLEEYISEYIPAEVILPAPGQGALAIQMRADDENTGSYLTALEDRDCRLAVTAERAFLAELGGGCSIPVGAYAQVGPDQIYMRVVVASPDGSTVLQFEASHADPQSLGKSLAEKALAHGAREVLNV